MSAEKLNKWHVDSSWKKKADALDSVKTIKQVEKELGPSKFKTSTKIVKEGIWFVVYYKYNRK